MTKGDIVGPVGTVTFGGGPWPVGQSLRDHYASMPSVNYTPPANTCDPRYTACTDHHVACDCREAEFAEQRQERRAETQHQREVFARVLAGHQVIDLNATNPYTGERAVACMCTGCQIARAFGYYTGRAQP